MAREIERKFVVIGDAWRSAAGSGVSYRQGYLRAEATVRVRIAGDRAFLTIKGKAEGAARDEFQYPIPVADAEQMLETLAIRPWIEKTRYEVEAGGREWIIDEFGGANQGLIVAEIELDDEAQPFAKPDWAGYEVTADYRYTNRSLVSQPYSEWGRRGV